MTRDEFVFAIPHDSERRWYPLDELKRYDEILLTEIHDWEARVRRGWVEVFQLKQGQQDREPRPVTLGVMTIAEVEMKFQ